VLIVSVMALGLLSMLYARVAQPLLALVEPGGEFEGFLTDTVTQIDVVVPALIAGMLLAMVMWFLASSVQEEQSRTRRRP